MESLRSALALERQRAELHAQTLQQELQAAQGRVRQLEADLSRLRASVAAELFSQSDLEEYRNALTSNRASIGRTLLFETHPTGSFTSVSSPVATLSTDRRSLYAQYTVRWVSAFDSRYSTTYRVVVSKGSVDRVEVVSDGALINVEPSFLRDAQRRLHRELFG
ncbi:MAG: hypothetical protein RJQ04_18735 [Longimicrobiales bacterium]